MENEVDDPAVSRSPSSASASMSRRDWCRMAIGGAVVGPTGVRQSLKSDPQRDRLMNTRPIPSTGEAMPIVGLGTWQTFDVGESDERRAPLREVLRIFGEHGGRMIDSSPMYGSSESVVGQLTQNLRLADDLFFATKVWTRGREAGIAQMGTSMDRMRRPSMDLMQIHNLVDVDAHLGTLREWKQSGRIRYLGVTHYQVRAFDRLERLIRSESLDFVQFNYSMATREAERRLLEVAADHGTAVVINRPYEGGSLFRAVTGRTLPSWATGFDCTSWGQFFLKYLLARPEVTCVIPGTARPEHLLDNVGAGRGRLPDEATRRRMAALVDGF